MLVVRGNLPAASEDHESETAWADALTGITDASQLTIAVLEGKPSPDDAAVLLLCDVVLASTDASLGGWDRALPPPSVAATDSLHAWIEPGPWTVERARSAGLVDELLAPTNLESRLAEWLATVASWNSEQLRETRALVRGVSSPVLTSAVAAWSQSRARSPVGE